MRPPDQRSNMSDVLNQLARSNTLGLDRIAQVMQQAGLRMAAWATAGGPATPSPPPPGSFLMQAPAAGARLTGPGMPSPSAFQGIAPGTWVHVQPSVSSPAPGGGTLYSPATVTRAGGGTGALPGGVSSIGAAAGNILFVVGVVAAAGVQLAQLPGKLEAFGRSVLESQRHLSQFSAHIAGVFTYSQSRQIVRSQGLGSETAGTAMQLTKTVEDLADINRRGLAVWINVKNLLVDSLLQTLMPLAEKVADVAEGAKQWLRDHGVNFLERPVGGPVSDWLDRVADDANAGRRRLDDPLGWNWGGA